MKKLGDFFPKEEKERYIKRHLQSGQIVYLFCNFTTPPKEKYLVLAGAGNEPLLFIINSEIHPFIDNNPELRMQQLNVKKSDYDFFDHDSFVNCSKVIESFSKSEIERQLDADVGKIKGKLNRKDIKKIIRIVQNSRTISKHNKNRIINSLK